MRLVNLKIMRCAKQVFSLLAMVILLLTACKQKLAETPIFETITADKTGLEFSNTLRPDTSMNLFKYMYYYNGAGIGAADFNNDGKTDLFFAANQGHNKLFLNEGNLHFKDVSVKAGIFNDSAWNTGVSVIDINNDGLMDIYVCRVGKYKTLKGKNLLLVCQEINKEGVPVYKEKAQEYGIDFSGFSTQAAFLDYDLDGDIDMFLINHSVNHEGNYGPRANFINTYDSLAGDRLFRNDNGYFVNVTIQSGINSSKIGYGLGIAVSDINVDGWPDIYIGNDFHENDYLYINQHNGTFKDESSSRLMHTSQFTMGVDIADINNDAYPEIISMDMLPYDPYVLKRSLGEDDYDIFYHKIDIGYNYQFSRNNLQLNRRNGLFSEVGMYAGVYATDWSWCPLWMDFDNDGWKDLFISNGIPKRMNDIDYINFISSELIQQKLKDNTTAEKDLSMINKFPEVKIPNKFFSNNKNLTFKDEADKIKDNTPTFSNGAIYADLDTDGDLDVVVNNINDKPLVYRNKSNDNSDHAFTEIQLTGSERNIRAIGAKVIIYTREGIRTYENFLAKGFQSSMQLPTHIGRYKTTIDSAVLIWPDNSYEKIDVQQKKLFVNYTYRKGLSKFDYTAIASSVVYQSKPLENIAVAAGLNYLHQENTFNEFNRELLLPRMFSTEGPALTVGDVNSDGLDDVFIGSSKWFKSALFVQNSLGKLEQKSIPVLDNDSTYEDVDACFADVNNDGNTDIIVASGGNEYYGNSSFLLPRVYLSNRNKNFIKKEDAFDKFFITQSCIIPNDFNGDGYVDLFIGGRAIPWAYGQIPNSYLLQNDGTGKFKDVTEQYAKDLSTVGFVTHAVWFDIDVDGDKDLLLSLEWGGIVAYINNKNNFKQKILTEKKGWWNFVLPYDVDNDGDIDVIAGNLGLNTRLTATADMPVRLYYNDFDDNGTKEQILTYYLQGKEVPFLGKPELEKQMPKLKKNFLYAEDFAKASMEELFSAQKLNNAKGLTANYFSNALLINAGNLNFEVQALPWQAQLTAYKDAVIVNANNDMLPDVMMVGNYYENNIEMGRYDADFGTILINKGKGQFIVEPFNGTAVKGQPRHVKKIKLGNLETYVIARNNDSAMLLQFKH